MNMAPCCVTVMRSSDCSVTVPVAARGRSTRMPTGSVRKVVNTTKNRTRKNMTSIRGTMLIVGPRRRCRSMATSLTSQGGQSFQEFGAAAIHLRDAPVNDAANPLVPGPGRDGDNQPRCGRDQRLRDAEAEVLGRAESLQGPDDVEGTDDAGNSPKESQQGRNRGHEVQDRQPPLHLVHFVPAHFVQELLQLLPGPV